jgi:hypothetical protein
MVTRARPTTMAPATAAKALVAALGRPAGPLTIADAAAKSGLPLRDAELGMHQLVAEYRGHLRATDRGELVFVFPHGFTKPWIIEDRARAALRKVGRAISGVARFVVRAWISIVLVGYVGLFLALVIALTFARQGGNDRDDGAGRLVGGVLRALADALFWTFHPFSPLSPIAYREASWGAPRAQTRPRPPARADEPTFYEKVNRFVFGPPAAPTDPSADERRILAAIRAGRGRIGLGDVMRATGLPREQADPLMARLMVDYDGDVSVSPEGGITYRFPALRTTADAATPDRAPEPAWTRPPFLPPLTGNGSGTNLLIVALNGFNLLMSLVAIANGFTFETIGALLRHVPPWRMPPWELPIALGVVPLVFSFVLFALPIGRALLRTRRAKRVAQESGRLAVLREVLERVAKKEPVREASLKHVFAKAAGVEPDDRALTRELVRLGGDVDVQADGQVRYRFVDLETEAVALEAEREAASEEERSVGKVVFSSES